MLNTISITGRLVETPELRHTATGTPVTSPRVAVTRDYKREGEQDTDFFDVVAWRGTAEFICKHFVKGELITIVGRLQNRQWTDKEGNKRTSAEIIAERAYFGGSKQRDKTDSSGGQRDYGAQHDDGYNEPSYAADPAQGNYYGSYSPFDN